MNTREPTATVRWAAFAAIVLVSAALTVSAARYAVADQWAQSTNAALWLRAAKLEPANAENWYRLGRYRQFDFENGDLPLAISYYERATAVDPGSSSYWMDLGSAYEMTGNVAGADLAFRNAQKQYPVSAQADWAYGNFLLRQGSTQDAFRQIYRAISADPRLTAVAISSCWRSTHDIDQILKLALPANPEAYWGAIDFFVSTAEPDAAMAVWKNLAATRATFPASRAFRLMDLLISLRRPDDARLIWQQTLSLAHIAPDYEPNGSVVWDGGFEQDLLNGGFAWQYSAISGAGMDIDAETFHSGKRSLRIVFDGTVNVDFANVWQYVSVEPNSRYRFRAYLQTQAITTDSGVRFEISDVYRGGGASTRNVIETQDWTAEEVEVSTGPETRLLKIVLRRTPSNKFGNKIKGIAWVDDVSMVALPATGSAPR